VRSGTASSGPPTNEKDRVNLRMDTISCVKHQADLRRELDRLNSRLAQGRRDHLRSHDDLRRLGAEIRHTKNELRTRTTNTAIY
jgi:hypothetical protein